VRVCKANVRDNRRLDGDDFYRCERRVRQIPDADVAV